MAVILSNFNHERWMLTGCSLGAQRRIVEECLKWSTQRIVFGKPLTAQAVIRAKLGAMISRVEACQNWLESVTYQMDYVRLWCFLLHTALLTSRFQMNYAQQATHLAGPIALCKTCVGLRSFRCSQITVEMVIQIRNQIGSRDCRRRHTSLWWESTDEYRNGQVHRRGMWPFSLHQS
jgi:alkylation response protein AidB-like acyl-CoA dehydrogenase